MTTRNVYHTIRRPDGAPWPGVSVVFRLVNGGFTGSATYPADALYLTTGSDGALTATLWINTESAVAARWQCALPDGSTFDFDLPAGDGSPVALSDLRAAEPYVPATSLASLLDAHVAAANPHPQYATDGDLTTHAGLTTTAHGGLVAATDSRLSDARTPTAHKSSHATGGGDALAPADIGAAAAGDLTTHASLTTTAHGGLVAATDSRLSDARTPTAHTHVINDTTGLQATLAGVDVRGGHALPRVAYSSRVALSPSAPLLDLEARAIIGVANGAEVATWMSGDAQSSAATAAAGQRPTYQAAGLANLPALVYAGDQFYSAPSVFPTGAASSTQFAIASTSNLAVTGIVMGSAGTNSHLVRLKDNGAGAAILRAIHGYVGMEGGPSVALNAPAAIVVAYDHVSNRLFGQVNGRYACHATAATSADASLQIGRCSAFPLAGQVARASLWGRLLTPHELHGLAVAANAYLGRTPPTRPVFVFVGGSTTRGYLNVGEGTLYGNHYVAQTLQRLGLDVEAYNYGASGTTAADMLAAAATGALTRYDALAPANIAVIQAGSNDITAGDSGSVVHARVESLCRLYRAVGYTVVVQTVVNKWLSTPERYQSLIDLNTLIRANWTAYADGMADAQACPELQDVTNVVYFHVDQTHLTAAGAAALADVVVAALTAV